jgi:hypothetical protein
MRAIFLVALATIVGGALAAVPATAAGWTYDEMMSGTAPVQPAAASWGPGRIDVFSVDGAGAVQHKYRVNDGAWSATENMGGTMTGRAVAVAPAPNDMEVYARTSTNALKRRVWGGSAWGSWQGLSLATTAAVSASARDGGSDVFARGTDGTLRYRRFGPGATSGWVNLGGMMLSAPASVSWGTGRVDVFWQGVNNTLQHRWYLNGAWGGPEQLGGAGTTTGTPDVITAGANTLDIFTRGTDTNMHWFQWNLVQWMQLGSVPAPGCIQGTPAGVFSNGQLQVFAQTCKYELADAFTGFGVWSTWTTMDYATDAFKTDQPVLSSPTAIVTQSGYVDVLVAHECDLCFVPQPPDFTLPPPMVKHWQWR